MVHPDLLLEGAGCVAGEPAVPESTMLAPSPPMESGSPASLVVLTVPADVKSSPELSVWVVPLRTPPRLSGQQ